MRREKGFSLIELIMTIVVVGIIAIPLSLLISQYITSFSANEDLTYASQLARLELERTFSMAFGDINSASFSQYDGYAYDLDRNVSYQQGDDASEESLKRIEITLYPQGKTNILTKFTTYRAKNVSF